ncbi:MAG TPA: hypothetical protein DCG22_08005 [Bacteroidetes bacterium]|nr:hypothetical protein [Bacteroidota bacterium]
MVPWNRIPLRPEPGRKPWYFCLFWPYLYGNSAAMEQDWMMVYNTADRQQAWIVRSALEEQADIRVVAVDKTSSPYGFALPGEVELYVHTSQAEKAIELIYAMETAGDSDSRTEF